MHFSSVPNRKDVFKIPNAGPPDAAFLPLYFLPDSLLDEFVAKSNEYARSRYVPNDPLKRITKSLLLRFLAAIIYIGVIRLPTKVNHRSSERSMPNHPALSGISSA